VDIVAPATGTPETGGWTTRELRTIIRGLEGINLIAADIVEVAPAYDTNAELTTMAAAVSLFFRVVAFRYEDLVLADLVVRILCMRL
jgi:arginase family enzyme